VTHIPGTPASLAGPPPVQDGFDQTLPNSARIYNWLLGGTESYPADQQAARRLLRAVPQARQAALDNREFLTRAVRWLASRGITQFIEIGSGLPARCPVHETARTVHPDAAVAYIDHDDIAVARTRAALGTDPGLCAVRADLRSPRDLMTRPDLRRVIDLTRPAAVLLTAVAHYLTDNDDPWQAIRVITDRLAPGSYIAVSHATADGITPEAARAARAACAGASMPVQPRTRHDVARLLAGLDPVPPGITDARTWQLSRYAARPAGPVLLWAGAARIPGPATPHREDRT
jgi:hypothetical protein